MADINNFYSDLNKFEENVKLSWQEFGSDRNFCDVTLACEDKQIQTHKLIICSFSPVLRNIMKFNQTPNPLIYLTNVKYRNLQNLLSFMYQGEVNISEEDLPSLFEVAKDLKVRGLCEKKTKHISQSSNQNIDSSPKRTRTTESKKVRKIIKDDPIGPITKIEEPLQNVFNNDIDSNKLFAPKNFSSDETNLQNILSFMYQDEISSSKEELPFPKRKRTTENEKSKNGFGIYSVDPIYKTEDDDTKIIITQEEILSNFNQICKGDKKQNGITAMVEVQTDVDNKSFLIPKEEFVENTCRQIDMTTVIIQNDTRSHPCSQCNYKAKNIYHLAQHINSIHEGECHPCDQCDYKATDKSNLKRHINAVHKGERYSCGQCDKTYTQKDPLLSHIKSVHEGERYPCDKCNYKGTNIANLKKHIKVIHEGKRYPCKQCNYKATTKSSIIQHIKSIHDGERHPCDKCEYKATVKSHLRRHQIKMHN